MGIDAEMFVKLNYKIEETELGRKSYIFGSMFKSDLFLGYDEEFLHHPLEVTDTSEYPDFYSIFKLTVNDSLINIPVAGRYYGLGYERGPLMSFIAMAEFLELLFPGQEIWYGGDSGGASFVIFDRKAREELMVHAIKYAHEPYNRGFSGEHGRYTCPHCKVGMIQFGWKGNLGYFKCVGCGWTIDEISKTETKSGYNLQMEFGKK